MISFWILFWAGLTGYLCGSIPFGLLLSRMAGLGDIRHIGSGNIGATNVLRTGNRKVAALTLVMDGLKGFLPVIIFMQFGLYAGIVAGFGALFGHIFPVWLKFRGGKGVATFIGVLFGLYWPLGFLFLGLWLVLAFLFKISSLSALIAAALMPFCAWALGQSPLIWPCGGAACVIWLTHAQNILRLIRGQETSISFKKKS